MVEAAVNTLSLEGKGDRNRKQRINRRAKFSPTTSCLYFHSQKASGNWDSGVLYSAHSRMLCPC